ncbi:MAG: hypothetical protein ACFFCZ_14105 [Promethearchaeota archaeon]
MHNPVSGFIRGIDIQCMRPIPYRKSGIIWCGEGGPASGVPLVLNGVQISVRGAQVNGGSRGVDGLVGGTIKGDHGVGVVSDKYIDS